MSEHIKSYLDYLKSEFKYKKEEDLVTIATPYTYRDGDMIMIYIKEENNEYLLTDKGETIRKLHSLGYSVDIDLVKEAIENRIGISLKDGELMCKIKNNKPPKDGKLRFKIKNNTRMGAAIFDLIMGCLQVNNLILVHYNKQNKERT